MNQLGALPASDHVTIHAAKELSVSISPKAIQAALKPLEACRANWLKTYGLDPAALAAIAKPAEPVTPLVSWVSYLDDRGEALVRGLQGAMTIVWMIGLDCRASGCRVLISSGHEVLDVAACKVVTNRARHRPALDHQGKRILSWESRRVRWQIS